MMNLGEAAVVASLTQAVSTFTANLATLVPDIYGYETAEHQQEITTWWENPANQLTIQIGYTSAPVQGLSWNVVVGDSPEVAGRRYVGNVASQSGSTTTFSTTFETTYHIGCLGVNQNWLLWSQMLCKWALLYMRPSLETQYGLFNQLVSLSPLQPVPDNLRDAVKFAFMRGVMLRAQHEDAWTSLPVSTVTSASVIVNPTEPTI